MFNKIAVVGAGNVGATTAQRLAEAELAKTVVLVDVAEGIPQGKALDLAQSGPVYGYDTQMIGTNGYDEVAGAELVVITAGIARKPGMSRDDLLETNAKIIRSVSQEIKRVAPDSIVIVVSNPLDVMCHVALEATGFPKERVIGMAGVLDTSRFRTFIAEAADVSVKDVQAFVLGGHGDSMVPLVRYSSIAGIPIDKFIAQDKLDEIVLRARNGGAEIVKHLKTGSAFYAPSASVLDMVESIVKDKKRILPAAAYLQGEYGVNNLYVGVPCKLGAKGLLQVIELDLTAEEKDALSISVNDVAENVEKLKAFA
ncbi:MAG: malate dehydrogenase [Vampirovibrionales bacterium]|jgi:malate dehydrogenase|nr:malate dehydrogenase [Vampirovibrionales bacterium]